MNKNIIKGFVETLTPRPGLTKNLISIYRNKILLSLLPAIFSCVLLAGCDRESKEETQKPYSENSNYDKEISSALTQLKNGQRLMLIFGANWCPSCRRLDASISQPEISEYLKQKFSIIKINIGRFDKNLHIAHRYKLPIKQGIPSIVVINKDETISLYIKTGELAQLHKSGRKVLYKKLKEI